MYDFRHQGRSQRGAGGGGPPPLIKCLPPPLVGLGRYIESFQNKKFSNKNTLVHIKKNSLASGGFAPGFLYTSIQYVTTLEQV